MVTQMHILKNKNIILGDGLCAYGVSLALKNFEIYASKVSSNHKKIESSFRPDPIISNISSKGLSNYYHGVSPSSIFFNYDYIEPLQKLGFKISSKKDFVRSSYFVPRFVPRPQIKKTKDIKKFDLESKQHENLFFCLSVVGNLNILSKLKKINEIVISDDLVFKIGNISCEDYNKSFSLPFLNMQGAFFPSIEFEGGFLSFRPVFIKETSLNFIELKEDFKSNRDPIAFFEKALKAFYLRYGINFFKVRYWECYVQKNIKSNYVFRNGKLIEIKDSLKDLEKSLSFLLSIVENKGLRIIDEKISNISSGIHLGYDRDILSEIPSNINFLDTSLNPNPGLHPTIISFCESYILSKSKNHLL